MSNVGKVGFTATERYNARGPSDISATQLKKSLKTTLTKDDKLALNAAVKYGFELTHTRQKAGGKATITVTNKSGKTYKLNANWKIADAILKHRKNGLSKKEALNIISKAGDNIKPTEARLLYLLVAATDDRVSTDGAKVLKMNDNRLFFPANSSSEQAMRNAADKTIKTR